VNRRPTLELTGIAKLYGNTVALRALDLRLEPRQTLALLGPNGSGKTTLLRIIAGATAPTLGHGTVLGSDLLAERHLLRARVGFLASDSYLYDDLTVAENLRFIATMAGRRVAATDVAETLQRVGLTAATRQRVRSLSSGMQRRLALGRLVLLRPQLLLLDEPYNSLDASAAELVDEIVREAADRGGSVVLATHDAERALALADLTAVLERGAVTFLGPSTGYHLRHVQHVG